MTADFDPHLNLERLKILTEREDIVPLKSISMIFGDRVEYECTKGRCVGRGLFKSKEVAVQYAELDANTELVEHSHDNEIEILRVVAGELFSDSDGVTTSASAGDAITIPAGESHIAYCVVPTVLIGITIPASEGYPNARK